MSKRPEGDANVIVAPRITDKTMQNQRMKTPADAMLKEMGYDEEEENTRANIIDNKQQKTAEEQTVKASEGTSTVLIVVFALLVIALVALIVWMVLKQSEDRSEEEEVHARLRPHPRNTIPPGYQRLPPGHVAFGQQPAGQLPHGQPPAGQPPHGQRPAGQPAPTQPTHRVRPPQDAEIVDPKQIEQELHNAQQADQAARLAKVEEKTPAPRKESAQELLKRTEAILEEDTEMSPEDKSMLASAASENFGESEETDE